MNKEIVDNKIIERYLEKLVATFGVRPLVSDQVLKKHFENKHYRSCVSEIKKSIGLKNNIKLTAYSENLYPCKTSLAMTLMPGNMPQYGTKAFEDYLIHIRFKDVLLKHFYTFVAVTTHELSHWVLNSTRHELRKSEVATDLCVLVLGFSEFARKGHLMINCTQQSSNSGFTGYLNQDQLHHALLYLNYLQKNYSARKPSSGHTQPITHEKTISFWDSINKYFK